MQTRDTVRLAATASTQTGGRRNQRISKPLTDSSTLYCWEGGRGAVKPGAPWSASSQPVNRVMSPGGVSLLGPGGAMAARLPRATTRCRCGKAPRCKRSTTRAWDAPSQMSHRVLAKATPFCQANNSRCNCASTRRSVGNAKLSGKCCRGIYATWSTSSSGRRVPLRTVPRNQMPTECEAGL